MSRFDNERKKSGYTENNLKKELKVEEVEEEEEEEVEVLNNIMNSNNETTTSANDNKIADVILAMFQIQATLRVSHFLSEKKSDHETLDKFLKKFNKKMDKFIEVWMGKHEKFDLGKNRQVNVYQITKDELFTYLDIVLEFLTGDVVESNVYKLSKYPLKNIMNNKKNIDLMSIRDDIVKNINRMKYRLRLE
jgi:hypothetical protein